MCDNTANIQEYYEDYCDEESYEREQEEYYRRMGLSDDYYYDEDDYYDLNYTDDEEDYSDNSYYYPDINKQKKQIKTHVSPLNIPSEKKMRETGEYDIRDVKMEKLFFRDGKLIKEETTYGEVMKEAREHKRMLLEKKRKERRRQQRKKKKNKKKKR